MDNMNVQFTSLSVFIHITASHVASGQSFESCVITRLIITVNKCIGDTFVILYLLWNHIAQCPAIIMYISPYHFMLYIMYEMVNKSYSHEKR